MLIETQVPPISPISDHGLMSGLGDDDHTQYLLANGSRNISELYVGSGMDCYLYTSGGDACLYADSGEIILYPTSRVELMGDLYLSGINFSLGYDGLRIRQNNSTYAAEYDSWDKNEHYFQYQGTDLFAVKSTGIYIYGGGDEANIKMVSNNLEIYGGYGDIILWPYNTVIAHYLYAPEGLTLNSSGTSAVYDSSGDMCFDSPGGFYFDGYALQSAGGYMSSSGNSGVNETVSTSGGDCYFEDGLLVYYSVF